MAAAHTRCPRLLPLVPSETIVITSGVVAAQGGLLIWLVVPLAAIGALVGDNVAYLLGAKLGDPVARRLWRGERARDGGRARPRALRSTSWRRPRLSAGTVVG
ncbi:MAG: hypothetical protein M3296_01070 [Actinomycetota bacterium]|nr:hypothetical protein [Actinomycetota bacterium]